MTEKVIQEIRLIETDDGYRLEVKGDKEQLKKMGFGTGIGFHRWIRPSSRRHRRSRHGRFHHGTRRESFPPPWTLDYMEEEADADTDNE